MASERGNGVDYVLWLWMLVALNLRRHDMSVEFGVADMGSRLGGINIGFILALVQEWKSMHIHTIEGERSAASGSSLNAACI